MLTYLDVLTEFHQALQPATYLEIGVHTGDSLELARPETVAVGVDPAPVMQPRLDARTTIVASTSDEFFASDGAAALFGGRPVDLAFIDGLHLFEQALRDFMNVERLCGEHSLIVLHDVLPSGPLVAARAPQTSEWTGDVWKVVLCLLDLRPGLEVHLVDVTPSGLCLVRGADPGDRTIADGYSDLVGRYQPLEFDEWQRRLPEVLARTTANPESRAWAHRMELAAQADARELGAPALERRLEEAERRQRAAEERVQALLASTSWRLTSPLRRLGDGIRRRRPD